MGKPAEVSSEDFDKLAKGAALTIDLHVSGAKPSILTLGEDLGLQINIDPETQKMHIDSSLMEPGTLQALFRYILAVMEEGAEYVEEPGRTGKGGESSHE